MTTWTLRITWRSFSLCPMPTWPRSRRTWTPRVTSGRAVIANFGGMALGDIALVPAPFLKDPKGIRDVTEWYMSLKSRRDYIHGIFERQTEIALENLARVHRAIGNSVDAVFLCGTDFGTQTSAFCSVPTFRDLWLPYYKRMCDWIHAHTTWKCFKHSCGSVKRFYDSFIEAGFEIVNPVQCSATGMDPELLKQEFGDRLTFWGGGVDTQKTLAVRNARRGARAGAPAVRDLRAGRRFHLQLDPQHPGGHAGREHRGDVRRSARVQRAEVTFCWEKRGVAMADLKKLYDAILNGDAKTAVAITKEAIDEKVRPP